MLALAIARCLAILIGVVALAPLSVHARSPHGDRVAAGMATAPTAGLLQDRDTDCPDGPDLPRRLATQSKYDPSIASKSIIDVDAKASREAQLAPVTAAIRSVSVQARENGSPEEIARSAACTIAALRHWAASAALTDMATSDANLTRDRFTSDIAGIVMTLQARGQDLRGEHAIRAWLSTLARQTMAYYDWTAGPTSRRNNHRYLAGLAVAEIGGILGDAQMLAWSRDSFALGACQIDDAGFLPLELARAERAYDYHLYAYGALNRLAIRLEGNGTANLPCVEGLDRLHRLVARGPDSARDFQRRTGLRQLAPSRLQLTAAELAPPRLKDMQTTGNVKKM